MFSVLTAKFSKTFLCGKDRQYFWTKLYWLFVSSIFSNNFFRKAENLPQQCTKLFLSQICGLWQST